MDENVQVYIHFKAQQFSFPTVGCFLNVTHWFANNNTLSYSDWRLKNLRWDKKSVLDENNSFWSTKQENVACL